VDQAIVDPTTRERIHRFGLAEYVGAARQISDRLRTGPTTSPLGHALVLGAADWRRAGMIRPVPREVLLLLAEPYLPARERAQAVSPGAVEEAITWATEQINTTVSLLVPVEGGYEVFDYALDLLTDQAGPVPRTTWQLAIGRASDDELIRLGYDAELVYEQHAIAEQAWRKAAEAGNTDAMSNLGVFLKDRNPKQAERWSRQGAESGNHHAMNTLGMVLKDRDPRQAEQWWRRAAEAWNADAMFNLGVLIRDRDPEQAEQWYRRAAKAGQTEAMYTLGWLLQGRNPKQAEQWYRRAAEAGHTEAMYTLGGLLKDHDPEQAERWWRLAAYAAAVAAQPKEPIEQALQEILVETIANLDRTLPPGLNIRWRGDAIDVLSRGEVVATVSHTGLLERAAQIAAERRRNLQ